MATTLLRPKGISAMLEDWDNSYNNDVDLINRIDNVALLTNICCVFPSFVDAEIVNMTFSRGNTLFCMDTLDWSNLKPASILVEYLLSKNETNNKSVAVSIAFIGIKKYEGKGFNYQNSIRGLGIRRASLEASKKEFFRVDWGGAAMRHDVSLVCESISIINLKIEE